MTRLPECFGRIARSENAHLTSGVPQNFLNAYSVSSASIVRGVRHASIEACRSGRGLLARRGMSRREDRDAPRALERARRIDVWLPTRSPCSRSYDGRRVLFGKGKTLSAERSGNGRPAAPTAILEGCRDVAPPRRRETARRSPAWISESHRGAQI